MGQEAGKIDFRNFNVLGLRHEKYFAAFGFENNLAYLTAPVVAEGISGDAGIVYTTNFVLNASLAGTTPFFTAGLGLLRKFGDSIGNSGTKFLANVGFGIKTKEVLGKAGLRFDFRRFVIYDVLSENLHNTELSIGLVFSF